MTSYTISVHNGHVVSQGHNRRERKITNKEEHIDPQGIYEIWHDEKLPQAYKRIFGLSIEEYNQNQKRADRRIYNYLKKIKQSPQSHPVYESIITIGNMDNHPSVEQSRTILNAYYEEFKKENPNMEIVGAYFHADEQGAPHLHLDYVPVGADYKRGPYLQNSLNKALKQLGYTMQKNKGSAIIQWGHAERLRLINICREHGLTISQPKTEAREHLHTEEFKLKKQLAKLQSERDIALNRLSKAQRDIEATESLKNAIEDELNTLKAKINNEFPNHSIQEILKKAKKQSELVNSQKKYEKLKEYTQSLHFNDGRSVYDAFKAQKTKNKDHDEYEH